MAPTNVTATSASATQAAVEADNTGGGTGVHGTSVNGFGVFGEATGTGRGVVAISKDGYGLRAGSTSLSAIRASSANGVGIEAAGGTAGGGAVGATDGIVGSSPTGNGVRGETDGAAAGVLGVSKNGMGVSGLAQGAGAGVFGQGPTGGSFDGALEGIHAVGHHPTAAGIAGYNDNTGPGIYGKSTHGAAGYFDGDVVVTGDVRLTGADLAEHFEVGGGTAAEPGTVMVLAGVDRVAVSESAYDRKVVGIVSGAESYRPGVVLDHHADVPGRQPLALVGKAFCKVDASFGAVEVGDLLTTSPTRGHAMKATEPGRAFGSVLGKAMAPLSQGRGLVPVLVTLQ